MAFERSTRGGRCLGYLGEERGGVMFGSGGCCKASFVRLRSPRVWRGRMRKADGQQGDGDFCVRERRKWANCVGERQRRAGGWSLSICLHTLYVVYGRNRGRLCWELESCDGTSKRAGKRFDGRKRDGQRLRRQRGRTEEGKAVVGKEWKAFTAGTTGTTGAIEEDWTALDRRIIQQTRE